MDVQRPRSLLRVFRLGLFLTATLFLGVSAWAVGPKIPFNIPAGSLSEALRTYREQSGVVPLYSVDLNRTPEVRTKSIVTHAVDGRYDVAEALKLLLEGTGLTFEFSPAHHVWIVPVVKLPAAPKPRQPALANPSESTAPPAKGNGGDSSEKLQEVTVTGSFIRGLHAITAPLVVFGKTEKKQVAYGTVQDVLRTLPQLFSGNVGEDYSLNGNFSRGVGIDLRGLGTGATLILVDGRRQPVSGLAGDYVDVSTVPWSAVERIEVLTDGASAIYGSDAIAGVVNIIMRKDLSGPAETQIRYGATPAGADEKLLAQSFGHRWDSGHWLLTYQYAKRTALAAAERAYSANADKRPFGGSDLRTVFSNPGNIVDPATRQSISGIPGGQDGRNLTPADLLPGVTNRYNQMATYDLLPNKDSHSVFSTFSQKIGDRFELFAEGRSHNRSMSATDYPYTQLLFVPSTNPFFVSPTPRASFVLVNYNFLNELGPITDRGTTATYTGAVGVKLKMSERWQGTVSGYYGTERMRWKIYNQPDDNILPARLADSDPTTAFNPFGAGSNTNYAVLDSLRAVQIEQSTSSITAFNLVADGTLGKWSAGVPKLALGLDWHKEGLSLYQAFGAHFSPASPPFERSVGTAFVEFSLPLVPHFTLSLAARSERYSDMGNTFNPKLGFRWTLNDTWQLRGSWGTSFRAPTLVDLYDKSNDSSALFPLADPHSPSGFSLVLGQQLSNPELRQETARTWTSGIDFSPAAVQNLTLSLSYYSIDYGDRIFHFPLNVPLSAVLADPIWAPLVTRNPSRAQIESVCNSRPFFGRSLADCLASSPDVIIDFRARNLSSTTVRGVDTEIKHIARSKYGQFDWGLRGSYMLDLEQRITNAAPALNLVGLALNPPYLRMRGSADWFQYGLEQSGWGVGIAADYLSAERYDSNSPAARMRSLTTFDLRVNYRTPSGYFSLSDVDLTLNAVNIFNRPPPFMDIQQGYDPANTKPYGRVVSFSAQKSW